MRLRRFGLGERAGGPAPVIVLTTETSSGHFSPRVPETPHIDAYPCPSAISSDSTASQNLPANQPLSKERCTCLERVAMQKVVGSNPFSGFAEIPLPSGISSFRGLGSVGQRWAPFRPTKRPIAQRKAHRNRAVPSRRTAFSRPSASHRLVISPVLGRLHEARRRHRGGVTLRPNGQSSGHIRTLSPAPWRQSPGGEMPFGELDHDPGRGRRRHAVAAGPPPALRPSRLYPGRRLPVSLGSPGPATRGGKS